jgi:ribosomal protein RSM22 (predicted rRNA methylase)
MQLPLQLYQALERELQATPSKELERASAELTTAYRAAGTPKPARSSSAVHGLAYAAVRMPATYAAVYAALSELTLRQPGTEISTLLDLGAGPGTATWAANQLFSEMKHATLIEQESGLIDLGRKFAANAVLGFDLNWQHQDLRQLTAAPHDLVILSYLIGEIAPGDLPKLIRSAWNATSGALVVVEPGTPPGYQRIIAVRELLISVGANLLAPCPHLHECPMLRLPGQWCHFAARVERRSMHRRIKAGTLGYEDEKFSYVIFSRNPVARADARIVRHPLKHIGHVSLELCAQEGLKTETVSRKQKELYRAARDARWGDVWPSHHIVMPDPGSI